LSRDQTKANTTPDDPPAANGVVGCRVRPHRKGGRALPNVDRLVTSVPHRGEHAN
jgi:hypothetical protein